MIETVNAALDAKAVTADFIPKDMSKVGASGMGDAVLNALKG